MCKKEHLVRYLDLAVYYGFHVLVFSIPLVFLTFTKEWFGIPKITLLRVGTIFILSCWLAKQLLSKQLRLLHTKLDLPVLIFLSFAFVSTLFSLHRVTSLLGKSGRYEGLTTLLAYGILFFLASQTLYEARRVGALLNTAILATSLISIYGLLQYLGYDFVSKSQLFWEPNRSFSTLGNPVLLGGYLAMMLPIILGKYLAHSDLRGRFLYGGVFLLSFATLVTTFSRGAWLAAMAGLLLLVFVGRKRVLAKHLVSLISVLALVLLLVVATNYAKSSSLPEENISILERISSVSEITEGSIGSRLLIWQSTLKMVAERPLLGWGPDVFHLAFPSFSSLDFVRLEGASKRADNAHNYFLQLAATQGLLGLFTYLALLILFFWTAFSFLSSQKRGKNHCRDDPRGRPNSRTGTSPVPTRNPNVRGRKRTHRHTSETPSHFPTYLLPLTTYYLYAGVLSGMAAYVAYLFSGINTVETGIMFWTLLGVVSVQAATERELIARNFPSVLRSSAILVIVVAALAISLLSLKPLLADIHYANAEKSEGDGFLDQAIEEGEAALLTNPYQDRYARYLGHLYMKAGDQTNALAFYLRAKRINQLEIDNSGRLAEFYLQKALDGEPKYYALAAEELSYILKIDPCSAVAHSGLGFVYLAMGRFEEAVRELNKAVSLDPKDAKAGIWLGKGYEKLNKKDKARVAYRKVLRLDPKNKDAVGALDRLKR